MTAKKTVIFWINNINFLKSHRLELFTQLSNGLALELITWDGFYDEFPKPFKTRPPLGILKRRCHLWVTGSVVDKYLQFKAILFRNKSAPIICISTICVFFGLCIQLFQRERKYIFFIAGMGIYFADGSRSKLKALAYRWAFNLLVRNTNKKKNVVFIVQNREDLAWFQTRCDKEQCLLVNGAGIDLSRARNYPVAVENNRVMVGMVSRLLATKGVYEFMKATTTLFSERPNVNAVLVGEFDLSHPESIKRSELDEWSSQDQALHLNHVDDIFPILAHVDIFALPSYREGFPRAVCEAQSMGIAVVVSDVAGCRDSVFNGATGILIPSRDPEALFMALRDLCDNSELRRTLGVAGKKVVESELGIEQILGQQINFINQFLEDNCHA